MTRVIILHYEFAALLAARRRPYRAPLSTVYTCLYLVLPEWRKADIKKWLDVLQGAVA